MATEQVQEQTASEIEKLRELIGARVVLWDLDGPLCRLFAGREAEAVTAGLLDHPAARGLDGPFTDATGGAPDPLAVLRAAAGRDPGGEAFAELAAHLAQEELRLAATALPTAFADPLIRTWSALGSRLAVTTDSSADAVRAYLDGRGLTPCFAPHLHGRTPASRRLTPEPDCLERALAGLGAAPDDALLIGGSPAGLAAARAAGVRFLGHARSEDQALRLREAGAEVVITSLEVPLLLLRGRRRG